jgi:hypothetical protein
LEGKNFNKTAMKTKIHSLKMNRYPVENSDDACLIDVRVSFHESAPHAHPGFTVGWTDTGLERFVCPGFDGTLAPGSVFILAPETIHFDHAGWREPAHATTLYLPHLYCPDLQGLIPSVPVTISEDIRAALNRAATHLDGKSISAVLLTIRPFLRAATQMRRRINSGSSASAHIRAFTRKYGCTPGAYDRQFMVRRCAELILEGAPLADAAIDAGFFDQSHMHRHFVRVFGVTPQEFQNRNSVQGNRKPPI